MYECQIFLCPYLSINDSIRVLKYTIHEALVTVHALIQPRKGDEYGRNVPTFGRFTIWFIFCPLSDRPAQFHLDSSSYFRQGELG